MLPAHFPIPCGDLSSFPAVAALSVGVEIQSRSFSGFLQNNEEESINNAKWLFQSGNRIFLKHFRFSFGFRKIKRYELLCSWSILFMTRIDVNWRDENCHEVRSVKYHFSVDEDDLSVTWQIFQVRLLTMRRLKYRSFFKSLLYHWEDFYYFSKEIIYEDFCQFRKLKWFHKCLILNEPEIYFMLWRINYSKMFMEIKQV